MNLLKEILGLNDNIYRMFTIEYHLTLVYGTKLLEEMFTLGLIYNDNYYTLEELKRYKKYISESNYYDSLEILNNTLKDVNYKIKESKLEEIREVINKNIELLNITKSKVKVK